MNKEKGLALVLVLWIVTLLIIMSSSFALTIQRESSIISGLKEKSEASALAEAGIYYAITRTFSTDIEQKWHVSNSLYNFTYNNKKVRILIADESGKVAINHAEKTQLLTLFDSIGVEEETAENLSEAILDWRDSDDLHRINGAELPQYEEAGLKYGPSNKAFKNIEEVQMVLGMTSEIYQRIEDLVSIYAKARNINPTTASREILLTLPDVDAEMVDEYIQQRVENERNFEPVTQPDWYSGGSGKSNVIMIVAEAMIDKDITQQVMAVVKKKKSKTGRPFKILKWSKNHHLPSLFQSTHNSRVVNN
ncbi:MAG: general secretion pathway protein GspK [Methylococcales bacterium]|nr:general secretion pathway protein GspK [Methylococcales bacterium]